MAVSECVVGDPSVTSGLRVIQELSGTLVKGFVKHFATAPDLARNVDPVRFPTNRIGTQRQIANCNGRTLHKHQQLGTWP